MVEPPQPVYGMCMSHTCRLFCMFFVPRRTADNEVCANCCCKDFNHLVNGYVYNNVFTAINNHIIVQPDTADVSSMNDNEIERESIYSMPSTKPNSCSGYIRSVSSDVRTPYSGPSVGSSFSNNSSRTIPAYRIPKHKIERGQRDDTMHQKKSKKYSSMKEKHVSIIFLESRRLSKGVRVPNGPADYAELRKHHQIIDDATLSTADAFDNLLGHNQFAEDWGSYFFYFRCGRMSLTPSAGYCFLNWPTSDIVTAFNQAKEIFVTEHCFEEEAVLFGLDESFSHCTITKAFPKADRSNFLLQDDKDDDTVVFD